MNTDRGLYLLSATLILLFASASLIGILNLPIYLLHLLTILASFPFFLYSLNFSKSLIIFFERYRERHLRGRAVIGSPPDRLAFIKKIKECEQKGQKTIDGYLVGFEVDSGAPIWISDEDMCSHGCVFAKTGVGKTLWLESIMMQQMSRGRASGFTFIDAKRDSSTLAHVILMAQITGRIEDLIVIDPFSPVHAYNFLLTGQRADVLARKVLRAGLPPTSDFSTTKHYDRLASDAIYRMVRVLTATGNTWTIKDISDALVEFERSYPHLKSILEKVGAKESVVELKKIMSGYRDGRGGHNLQRMNDNLRGIGAELQSIGSSAIGGVFSSNYTDLVLTDDILRGKIIYYMLPRLEEAETAAKMVKIFREDLEVSIGEITSSTEYRLEDPHLVIIDEGSSTFGPSWANLFELARKGRFSILFGAQSTGGLTDKASGLSAEFYERVMANVNLKVMMRIGDNRTAREMSEWFGKEVSYNVAESSSESVSGGFLSRRTVRSNSQSVLEDTKELVDPDELKHSLNEKGMAWFDVGDGVIRKGRTLWFNADVPEGYSGREHLVQLERQLGEPLGLSKYIEKVILEEEDNLDKQSVEKPTLKKLTKNIKGDDAQTYEKNVKVMNDKLENCKKNSFKNKQNYTKSHLPEEKSIHKPNINPLKFSNSNRKPHFKGQVHRFKIK
jgi:TraM recognition site of TraD and TraG